MGTPDYATGLVRTGPDVEYHFVLPDQRMQKPSGRASAPGISLSQFLAISFQSIANYTKNWQLRSPRLLRAGDARARHVLAFMYRRGSPLDFVKPSNAGFRSPEVEGHSDDDGM